MAYQIPTGTKDILPDEIERWHRVEETIRDVMQRYRYAEIRTPLFEYTELFSRGIGEATDVVGKEMYTFRDKGDESLTLRPEMTASVIRAFIQHNLAARQGLTKVYYLGPMFRQERPQKGRMRQFHQFGVESIGSSFPEADVETMLVALTIYQELKLTGLQFKINSVGCPDCRPRYREKLVAYLEPRRMQLSEDSQKRIATNPLRVLDSKDERDIRETGDAPLIVDHLCEACREHFGRVKELLTDVRIAFEVDGRLVRGLDYYTRTAYEIQSSNLGSQNALGGGGRYDALCEQLGGKPTPAVGFAAGVERLLIVLDALGLHPDSVSSLDCFVIAIGDAAVREAQKTVFRLRSLGMTCETDFLRRSMKAQMREANRLGAKQVVILGDEELSRGEAVVKNMESGNQENVALTDVESKISSPRG